MKKVGILLVLVATSAALFSFQNADTKKEETKKESVELIPIYDTAKVVFAKSLSQGEKGRIRRQFRDYYGDFNIISCSPYIEIWEWTKPVWGPGLPGDDDEDRPLDFSLTYSVMWDNSAECF
jgi:hypothetical protein